MSNRNMTNENTVERAVDRLRQRFAELMPLCGGSDRLATRLAEMDEYFSTVAGYNDVKNAKREKAGEVPMTRIVEAMEKFVSSSKIQSYDTLETVTSYRPKFAVTRQLQEKMKKNK